MSDAADRYRRFAALEAAGSSPIYEQLCLAIADDDELIHRLDELPPRLRQPNLLLAASTYLDAPFGDSAATLAWLHEHWDEVVEVMESHSTQTNEAARTGTILPALGTIPGPIALVEIGASAGLCLYPDRYRIDYGPLGAAGPSDSPVRIDVAATGPVPVPGDAPEIVARIGIDLNPLDVRAPDDMAWLEACIWPEHDHRLERLRRAATVVAADPPELVRGDLIDLLPQVLDSIPPDVTPVVIHSAVLAYLDREGRATAAEMLRSSRRARWISNEAPGVVAAIETGLAPPPGAPMQRYYIVGLDGEEALAVADPHGRWLSWRT
jgi:hypothetical protein